MDLRKRKLNPITTVPKKRKIGKTKVRTGEQNTLKKTFTKVMSDDGPIVYKVKGVEEVPINLKERVNIVNNSATQIKDSTATCSHIPDFTEKDIQDLINASDFNFFIENNNLDDAIDTFASSSTPDFQILSTPDVIDKSQNTTCSQNLDGPLDLSTTKDKPQNSTQMPSKPSNKMSARIESSLHMMPRQSEIPLAHSASKTVTKPINLMVDRECSSTTDYAAPPIVEKRRIWCTDWSRQDVHSPKSPAMILEELASLQEFQPSYDLQRLSNVTDSMFQCRARFKKEIAYGYGKSVIGAKNGAASSLLEKLISNMYFGNIIGRLQEFCMAHGWPLPMYGDEMNVYVTDVHGFILSCSVKKHRVFGHGKTKKMAKTFAAYKMWLKLTTKK